MKENENRKLEDWSSEDEDESTKATSKKFKGVVVLEGMFSLKELEEDATLLLDLKEDVRDECENLGTVTNVTLYDVSSPFILLSLLLIGELLIEAARVNSERR